MSRRLFGGSKSKSESSSSSGLDPRFANAYFGNLDRATNVANNLDPRQIADFGEDWFAGRDLVRGLDTGAGAQAMQNAIQGVTGLGGFTPQQVAAQQLTGVGYNASLAGAQGYQAALGQASQGNRSDIRDAIAQQVAAAQANRGDIRDVQAGSFLNANIQDYMNPFIDQVVDNTARDMDRSRQITQMGNAERAARAGAFGGSRQGVLEAETNRNFFDTLGTTVGNLRSAGFDAASQLAMRDIDRAMQADALNQGADFNVANLNTNLQQQAGLANAANNLQAQGLNQAQDFNMLNTNLNLQQQMAMANMAAQNQASQFGANAMNQASIANAGFQNQASQFGANATNQANAANALNALNADLANQSADLAGADMRMNAFGLLGDLGQTSNNMALAQANALNQFGIQDQERQQAILDAIRNLPIEQQQLINQALGINPGGGAGMTSTSTGTSSSRSDTGIFSQIGLNPTMP